MLDMLLSAKLPAPPAAWARVLDGVSSSQHLREARTRFERARSDGMRVDEATYAALLRACARAQDVPYAIHVLGLMAAEQLMPTEESVEHLLLACAQARDADDALQAILYIPPTSATFTTIPQLTSPGANSNLLPHLRLRRHPTSPSPPPYDLNHCVAAL